MNDPIWPDLGYAVAREPRPARRSTAKSRETRSETIRKAIEADIFAGRLPPGSRIDGDD